MFSTARFNVSVPVKGKLFETEAQIEHYADNSDCFRPRKGEVIWNPKLVTIGGKSVTVVSVPVKGKLFETAHPQQQTLPAASTFPSP